MTIIMFCLTVQVSAQVSPVGTCCPTTSGAVCIVGVQYRVNHYYLSEGDCPIECSNDCSEL